ncbi:MAG: hypothetical protein CMJ19_03660 [Phycisphaeraceae bacterium]|nr:hypothetical protein [Phycisphaeraceae bacterium]
MYDSAKMYRLQSNTARILLLGVWLFASLSNGLLVLCVGHNDHQQIEFALKDTCQKTVVTDACCDAPEPVSLCYEHDDCTDIPLQGQLSPTINLKYDLHVNLLAIAPLHLNIMAASPLDALKPTRLTTFNTQAPPRPDDPATTTGSILLLI